MGSYVAHYRESDKASQTIKEHLQNVCRLAETYGESLGVTHITGLAGMLHDVGKYSDRFQNYLYLAVFDPEHAEPRGSVDHATAGGKLLFERYHQEVSKENQWRYILSEIVGNAIFSHHSYLHDYINDKLESPFLKRAEKSEEDLYGYGEYIHYFFKEVISHDSLDHYVEKAVSELTFYLSHNNQGNVTNAFTLLARFVLSCLIDADRTDTRLFEEHKDAELATDTDHLFQNYYEILTDFLQSLRDQTNANSIINQLRSDMSTQCDRFAERDSGIYTLSIPTGGGKTLASLRYALKHALLYHKKQIIYVVPFTTIIEQNAKVIRNLLKDDVHILEHHSNVVNFKDENENDGQEDEGFSLREKLSLAKDNWDCPIILTTMVQFLDTFYKRGSGNIRRLHHLTESIIIFDEVQKVPVRCVTLFNQTLNFLKTFGKSSILLCTATQPALNYVRQKLETDGEIIDRLPTVISAFKRVRIVDWTYQESFNTDTLADFIGDRLSVVQSILVILNTRAVVRGLYIELSSRYKTSDVRLFHLSTSMCAAHREKILNDIKKCLNQQKKVVCISTQLIEAGVDVSFEGVIRSLAGLDSIAQAAGRCNRNGEFDGLCDVFIIDHQEEKLATSALKDIRVGKEITQGMLKDLHNDPSCFGGDLLSAEAVRWYFTQFYQRMDAARELDYRLNNLGSSITMVNLLCKNLKKPDGYAEAYVRKNHRQLALIMKNSPETAAKYFHVIDDVTQSVIVPYGRGREIIAKLNGARSIDNLGRLLREAQHYSVNLYSQDVKKLDQKKQFEPLFDGQVFALNEASYSDEFGVDIDGSGGGNFCGY